MPLSLKKSQALFKGFLTQLIFIMIPSVSVSPEKNEVYVMDIHTKNYEFHSSDSKKMLGTAMVLHHQSNDQKTS